MTSRRTYQFRHWHGVVFVLVAAILIAVAFLFDAECSRTVLRNDSTKAVAEFFNHWGDWPRLMLLGTAAGALAWFCRAQRLTRLIVAMLIACTVAGILANVIRTATGRTRPSAKVEQGFYGLKRESQWLLTKSQFKSFPSAHTTTSVAFAGVLLLSRWRIGSLLFAASLAVAWARVHAGAHHLSDVMAATVLGLFTAWWALSFVGRNGWLFDRIIRLRKSLGLPRTVLVAPTVTGVRSGMRRASQ